MKNAVKVLTVIALAAVIGFGVAGCEQPTDSPTAKTLTGISLNTDSVKKAYIQNETLNLSGLVVTANYSDGSKAAVTSYTADPASGTTLSAIETITVTVSYTEGAVTKTANFSVTVAAKALSGITAEYTGTTHVYPFTLLDSLKDHLAVTAQYNDNTSAKLEAEDYTLSGTLTAGTSSITASYTEGGVTKTATFDVTVTAATLESIAVEFDQDDATIYTSTPRDNLKQYLTVTATYTFTGSQETHEETLSAHEYTLSGELTAGTPTITVNYGGKTGNFTPTVTAVVLTGITAQYITATIYTSTPLDNLKQYLTVKAVYNDGNEKTLTANDYTLSGTLTAGTPTITVTYEGETTTFTPAVTAVVLDSITAAYTGGDVEINSDVDDLKTALTVTAHYNDGSVPTVSEYTLSSNSPFTTIGQKTITASYTDSDVTKTDTFTVTVVCTNHDWSNWTLFIPATCTTAGSETRTCSICDTTETRPTSIDPTAHDWDDWKENQPADGIEAIRCKHDSSHIKETRTVMVFVQGGAFQLGKDLGTAATGDVTPVSNVTVSGFYIGKYEVTQAQYQAVMGSLPINLTIGTDYGRGDTYPIYYVNWYEALIFCNKLSVLEGLTPAYRISNSTNPDDWGTVPTSSDATWNAVTIDSGSTGYRLPTEAQWEYAAKSGDPTAVGWVGYTYAGSDAPADVAWYGVSTANGGTSHVVGTKAPNGLGLYDMSGNVFEWCWDWYGNYTSDVKTDPTGASSGSYRVIRGGSWNNSAQNIRSADRSDGYLNYQGNSLGFRVLRPMN